MQIGASPIETILRRGGALLRWTAGALRARARGCVLLAVVLLCLGLIIRSAWLTDDAFITLRVVENFLDGRGLTWNTDERVQVYTHPLWLLLLSAAHWVSGEHYHSTLFLSIGVSAAALAVIALQHGKDRISTIVAVWALCQSKAFVDYSTSGLENPLTNLLLCLGYAAFWSDRDVITRLGRLSIIVGLSLTNRIDSILLLLPPLVVLVAESVRGERGREAMRALARGALPFLAWCAFSLFYYGSLLPNTAYAKLNTGVPLQGYVVQGAWYLVICTLADPVSSILVVTALVLGFGHGSRRFRPVGVALVLWLAYVLRIGGDFMAFRLFAGPVVLSAITIARARVVSGSAGRVVAATAVASVGLLLTTAPLRCGPDYDKEHSLRYILDRRRGVRDVRGPNFVSTGLFRSSGLEDADHPRARRGRQLRDGGPVTPPVVGAVGRLGFYSGPDVTIIDQAALCDALLARLPIADPHRWRIGHFGREIPPGYVETRETRANHIEDPDLALYYDHLRSVIAGDLWSPRRLADLWRWILGASDDHLRAYIGRHPPEERR